MEEVKVKKFGPSCCKQGSSVFYKAFKYKKDGKGKIITLGQFFFMKILDSIPICIGELQLVWEDKASSTDLASVRLYFLPECTPDGRQPNHGEDEVLAYYEKIVLKLNDLATMVVHNVSWSEGRRAFTASECARDLTGYVDLAEAFKMNSYGLDTRDVEKECQASDQTEMIEDSSPEVVIMTYPRYCRYRCMLKRLENCEDKWLHKTLICALGGFSAMKDNNRVYFCRDIFEHADLDDFEHRCDHLAPSLKGRPLKHRGSKRDLNDSSDDSSSSSSFSAQTENSANKVRTGSRATPLRNGFRIDKIKVSKDEQAFLIELHKFMKSRNTPIGRIPSLGFKQIDLFQFYSLAQEIGGYEQITAKRMWKNIYDALGGNPGSTSAATYTRRHYEKLLLPFERFKMGKEFKSMHNKKKLKPENSMSLSEKGKIMKSPDNTEVKVKGEIKIKSEGRMKLNLKQLENGRDAATNKDTIDNRDKALIIKQEIEKMKIRKDAGKLGTSIMNKANTKITATLDKKKSSEDGRKSRWGEKGRRPSGGQKTVRELLHQNGQDSGESIEGNITEKISDQKQKTLNEADARRVTETSDGSCKRETTVPSIPQVLPSTVSNIDTKPLSSQTILPNINSPRPMFYPQLIPVGGAIRNMTPIGMPFMIGPPFGFQTVANQMQSVQTIGSSTSLKEEKPLYALNKLVSEQSSGPNVNRNSIPSLHGKPNPPNITPPSAHCSQSTSKGPLGSPSSGPQIHRPITPAHSHNTKRQYPYPDTNRSHPTYSSNYSAKDIKSEPASDTDLKRQKVKGSQEKSYQSGSSEFEMPVLDLSMKTLRAQEARHQRGESLLFNTSFNKDSKTAPKSEPCDAPQDLSLKSRTNSNGNDRAPSVHKSVPLNIPFPRLPMAQSSLKKEEEVKKERLEAQSQIISSKPVIPPASSAGTVAAIGGLPLDFGSFVHPAFPQQMLMQGVFPTPMQLQQMIQGQVAAGMPMLRPDFIPSPLMFPPSMSIVTPTMFTNVLPSVAKTNTNNAPIVKR